MDDAYRDIINEMEDIAKGTVVSAGGDSKLSPAGARSDARLGNHSLVTAVRSKILKYELQRNLNIPC